MSGYARDFNNIETRTVMKFFFFCKARRRRKLTPFWQKHYFSFLVGLRTYQYLWAPFSPFFHEPNQLIRECTFFNPMKSYNVLVTFSLKWEFRLFVLCVICMYNVNAIWMRLAFSFARMFTHLILKAAGLLVTKFGISIRNWDQY